MRFYVIFSTEFQPYHDNGRVVMKAVRSETPLSIETIPASSDQTILNWQMVSPIWSERNSY